VLGRQVLTIFTSVPTGREQRCENGQGHWWMEPVYRWALVTQIPLSDAEPDWNHIEVAGRTLKDSIAQAIDDAA
jgi:hypothetical protein